MYTVNRVLHKARVVTTLLVDNYEFHYLFSTLILPA